MKPAEPGHALPFEPEPIDQLRRRYPDAIEKVWNEDAMAAFAGEGLPFDRPTLHRTYVFDVECGIRICISRSKVGKRCVIYASGSVHDHGGYSEIEKELLTLSPLKDRATAFIKRVCPLIVEITGRTDFVLVMIRQVMFTWMAPGGEL